MSKCHDEILPRPQVYTVLPIAQDTRSLWGSTCIGALILERTSKRPEVVQSETGERQRSEFRRTGWVEYTSQTQCLSISGSLFR